MRCRFLACAYAIPVWTVLALVLAVALSGCNIPMGDDANNDAAPNTISTSDGRARLTAPPEALPEGIALDDITVGEVSVDTDFFTAQEAEPPLAIFQLEPDGLQFSKPVTFIVELSVEDPSGPQVDAILVTGDNVELITDVESEVNSQTNTLTASIQLTHFSDLHIFRGEKVYVDEMIVSESEVPVGGTFEVTYSVTRTKEPGELIGHYFTRGLREGDARAEVHVYLGHRPGSDSGLGDDTWALEGRLDANGPVTPKFFGNVPFPPLTAGLTQEVFTLPTQQFECTAVGNVLLSYLGDASYHKITITDFTFLQNLIVGGDELATASDSLLEFDKVRCVEGIACCVSGTCETKTSEASCALAGGELLGDGKTCEANADECQPPTAPDTGTFQIVSVDFPSTLTNFGERGDLSVTWSGNPNFRVTLQFFPAPGGCPDVEGSCLPVDCPSTGSPLGSGFGCSKATITHFFANPLVLPQAFRCAIVNDLINEGSLPYLYQVLLTDDDGLQSDVVNVPFTCLPAE